MRRWCLSVCRRDYLVVGVPEMSYAEPDRYRRPGRRTRHHHARQSRPLNLTAPLSLRPVCLYPT